MHAHAITLLHHVSQMMNALDQELFQAFSILFLPVILVQVGFHFGCPNNAFPEVVWLSLDVFWWSNQAWFVPCGEPSVFALVKSFLVCRLDSDTLTSWRVFFSWLDVV